MGNGSARRPGRTGSALAVGSMLGVFLLSSPASAESSPRGKLEDFFGGVTAILSAATDAKQARDDVRDLAHTLFDGHGAARRALGPEWDRRTGAERDEFARTFRGVVENAYVQIVQARLPRGGPPAIRVIGEVTAEGMAIVRTQVSSREGGDLRVDYLMGELDETWLVHDVVIDGVSLVDNYRAQIARVLRRSSYADVVARLRTVGGTAMAEPLAAAPNPAAPPPLVAPPSPTASPIPAAPPPPTAVPNPDTPPSPTAAPSPAPPPSSDVVVAYFATSRADLSPAARRDLDWAAALGTANRQAGVLIEGHSDQRGDPGLNDALATRRANAIRDHLVTRGVGADRIATVTYGDRRPACQEPVRACWAENRRGIVRVTQPAEAPR